jgi:hypothetical protein
MCYAHVQAMDCRSAGQGSDQNVAIPTLVARSRSTCIALPCFTHVVVRHHKLVSGHGYSGSCMFVFYAGADHNALSVLRSLGQPTGTSAGAGGLENTTFQQQDPTSE